MDRVAGGGDPGKRGPIRARSCRDRSASTGRAARIVSMAEDLQRGGVRRTRSVPVRLLALVVPLFALPGPSASGEANSAVAASMAPRLDVGAFLVARTNLPDPNFFETVVLLLAYEPENGAAGLVVNRRSEISVSEAVAGAGLFGERQDSLYLGGPVAIDQILVLRRASQPPTGSFRIVGDVFLIHEREGLEELLDAEPTSTSVRFYAGHAGWAAGQLEDEISRGVWHVTSGDAGRVFSDSPEDAWDDMMRIVFGPRA